MMSLAAGLILSFGFALASQDMPPELAALVANTGIEGRVTSWCRAEFRRGSPGAFAVAVTSANGVRRYVAVDTDGAVNELATIKGGIDLSCYSRAEAQKLDRSIKESETIHGQIQPRWNTTVVCGFIDETSAICWQYSPAQRGFVRVGQWVT